MENSKEKKEGKKNENEKSILAAPGFEPTTWSGHNFMQNNGTFMNSPLATSGNARNMSSGQLAQRQVS